MLDIGEYIIDEPYLQYGNGYGQLDRDWATYYKIASKFIHKARFEDRDDFATHHNAKPCHRSQKQWTQAR